MHIDEDLTAELLGDEGPAPRPHRGRWRWVAAVLALAAIGAGTVVAVAGTGPAAAPQRVPVGTATVVRANVHSTQQATGTLGYLDAYTLTLPGGLGAAQGGGQSGGTQSQVGPLAAQLAGAQKALADTRTVTASQTAQAQDAVDSDELALGVAREQLTAAEQALARGRTSAAAACGGAASSGPTCAAASQQVTALAAQVGTLSTTVGQEQAALSADNGKLATATAQGRQAVDQAQSQVDSTGAQLRAAQSTADSTATATLSGRSVTRLPAVGTLVDRGQPVYWLDGQPVPLLLGSGAAYRPLQPGMPDGADVRQLQANLIALGTGSGVQVTGHFDAATAAGIRRLQQRVGATVTGSLGLGAVAFLPTPLRVTGLLTNPGGAAVPGQALLSGTSTTRAVIVPLQASQQQLVHLGDRVTVNMPDGRTTTAGHVTQVSTVATGGAQSAVAGSGTSAAGQSSATAQQQAATSTVPVTIALDDPAVAGALDQAPVTVDITDQTATGVLAVPVQALLALAGGGYGVRTGGGQVVPVTTGLFGDGMVQISGSGIQAGTIVEVPAS